MKLQTHITKYFSRKYQVVFLYKNFTLTIIPAHLLTAARKEITSTVINRRCAKQIELTNQRRFWSDKSSAARSLACQASDQANYPHSADSITRWTWFVKLADYCDANFTSSTSGPQVRVNVGEGESANTRVRLTWLSKTPEMRLEYSLIFSAIISLWCISESLLISIGT